MVVGAQELVEPDFQRILDDLVQCMRDRQGIGLAANQVGLVVRVCVIEGTGWRHRTPTVLINPEIYRRKGRKLHVEGCLSLPETQVQVPRSELVWIRALNRYGKPQNYGKVGGKFGWIAQHEVDHLEGRLISDYASDGD